MVKIKTPESRNKIILYFVRRVPVIQEYLKESSYLFLAYPVSKLQPSEAVSIHGVSRMFIIGRAVMDDMVIIEEPGFINFETEIAELTNEFHNGPVNDGQLFDRGGVIGGEETEILQG